ncbi:MAG: cyclic nucleotide-binding domain-containing protein [Ignavibacteriales bacterium]|nr:cyclic nucleotide-binding domain-containing protein [Ignavibacteriales bacterium]
MPKVDERINSLLSAPIFEGVPRNILKSLAKLFHQQEYPAGKVLVDLDSPSDTVYLIERGFVRISRLTSYGEETTLNVLGKGEIVGELSMIDGQRRSARVTCVTDCLIYHMSKEEFDKFVQSDLRVAYNLLKEVSARLRKANDTIVKKLEEEHSALETRFVKLNRLIEASKIINSTLDLDKLLGLILDAAATSIEADRGTLYLVDPFKQELWSKVLQGSNMVEIRLPMGKGIAGFVAQTGEVINIPDAYNDPRFNPDVDKRTGYRTHNMLCMPMKNKDGKIIGVFQLLNKRDGVFGTDDEQFIDALSAHASVAIENARMAQEMVQNERLSAVGRMASVIIHDIKNPMGTLRVYAQVMKRKSGNEEAAKLADEMIHQVDRFVNMTQEILDFTRGVSAMNFQELEFGEVMDNVLDFIEKDLEKNKVQLIKKPEFKGVIKLDQDKMVRVFYNIASNARDAMPNGGALTVSTVEEKNFVKVEFTDTGTGMPDEVKKRIFEPFMTYGKKHGTGLGMAIVKKVIDDHGGRIEIDSEMGKGTTIRILLPTKS